MFDLEEKINEIQSQPENIRMRWVYISVGVCMLFIVLIWIISLRINLTTEPPDEKSTIRDISNTINEKLEQEEDAQSIDELLDGAKNSVDTIRGATEGDVGSSLGSILEQETEVEIETKIEEER